MTNQFTYLNNGYVFKDMFLKHGIKGDEGFKFSHLHLKLVSLSDLGS